MKIEVVFWKGKRFTLEVKPTDTVRQVKKKIQKIGGPPADQQIAIFYRTELKDDKMLLEYSLHKLKKNVILDFYLEKDGDLFKGQHEFLLMASDTVELHRFLNGSSNLRERWKLRMADLNEQLEVMKKKLGSEELTSHPALR